MLTDDRWTDDTANQHLCFRYIDYSTILLLPFANLITSLLEFFAKFFYKLEFCCKKFCGHLRKTVNLHVPKKIFIISVTVLLCKEIVKSFYKGCFNLLNK